MAADQRSRSAVVTKMVVCNVKLQAFLALGQNRGRGKPLYQTPNHDLKVHVSADILFGQRTRQEVGCLGTQADKLYRGPAKGYIEGLEHRLHEAESLLLQVLPYVSTDQLQTATTRLIYDEMEEEVRGSPGRRGSPPLLNKKTGIDYWEAFPLKSASDIRRWQSDCEMHHSSSENGGKAKPESRHTSPHLPDKKSKRSSMPDPQPFSTSAPVALDDPYTIQPRQPMRGIQPQTSQMRMSLDQSQQGSWQYPGSMMSVNGSVQQRHSSVPQNNSFQQAQFTNNQFDTTSWQTQQNMQMTMSVPDQNQQGIVPGVNSQTHSHLFW